MNNYPTYEIKNTLPTAFDIVRFYQLYLECMENEPLQWFFLCNTGRSRRVNMAEVLFGYSKSRH